MDRCSRVLVFVDSNLGTHLAMDVSADTNVADFKRDLKKEHLNCFPKLGGIDMKNLMVKRRSFFYHLPNSMPIKYAFDGQLDTWFIHMEACYRGVSSRPASNNSDLYEPREVSNSNSRIKIKNTKEGNIKTKEREGKRNLRRKPLLWVTLRTIHLTMKRKRRIRMKRKGRTGEPRSRSMKKKRRIGMKTKRIIEGPRIRSDRDDAVEVIEPLASRAESKHPEEGKSGAVQENPRDTSSAVTPVSSIIQKYCCDYEEVASVPNDPEESSAILENPRDTSSGVASVSSIIRKYCCDYEEVGSVPNDPSVGNANTPVTPQTPSKVSVFPLPCDLSSKTLRMKFKRGEVGKRIMEASDKLGVSSSSKKRKSNRQLPVPRLSSSVFEICDSDS